MLSFSNEHPGRAEDLRILQEEEWLLQAVVEYNIRERKGRFWIVLLYIDSRYPMNLRLRWIDHHPSLRRAEQFAQILQRGVRRDPRGTVKLSLDAFNLCLN